MPGTTKNSRGGWSNYHRTSRSHGQRMADRLEPRSYGGRKFRILPGGTEHACALCPNLIGEGEWIKRWSTKDGVATYVHGECASKLIEGKPANNAVEKRAPSK